MAIHPDRRTFLTLAGAGVAAALAGCLSKSGSKNSSADPNWANRVRKLDEKITELMKRLSVPGVSVALIRDASLEWIKGFGVRDRSKGAPVSEATIFSAQSMSKPVFAYRVMKLCEQGVLDLDSPLTKYTSTVFVENDPRLMEITARRVLSHTSGLPNWRSKEDPLRINFQPGTKWLYSGEGYHYLQSVVTRLLGHTDDSQCGTFEEGYRVCATDFGDYMKANLLQPFGMKSSGYLWTEITPTDLARPHDKDGKPLPQKAPTSVEVARYGSAGSLLTTAADYAKFLIEVMQPKPSDEYRLNEASRREMLKPQIAAPLPFKASWGLGWQIWHLDKGDVVAHGGDFDGWHSQSAFSPERKAGFVILTNGENGSDMIWKQLLKSLVDDFVLS